MRTASRTCSLGGFTLVELLVVIAVFGIVIVSLLPVVSRSREKAKQTKCENLLRQFYTIAVMYADDHEGYLGDYEDLLRQIPMICPSDKSDGKDRKHVTYRRPTSFWASPFYFSAYERRRLDFGRPSENYLLCENYPFHDPSREIGFEPDKWKGRFLNLMADGRTRWPLLEQ